MILKTADAGKEGAMDRRRFLQRATLGVVAACSGSTIANAETAAVETTVKTGPPQLNLNVFWELRADLSQLGGEVFLNASSAISS